jgi:pilus assembly protein CpaB
MQAKTMILIVVAIICGLVATIGISQMVDGKGGVAGGETVKLFVASTNVDIGTKLDSQNVRLEEWPRDRVPEGAITKLDELESKYARQRLFPGEPIMGAKLQESVAGDISVLIPPGHRVCPIKVQGGSNAGANLIDPGDHVDVLVFLQKSSEMNFTGTKTILRDIRVFAVDHRTQREVAGDEAAVKNAQSVSLLVTPKQAERLTLASELGSLRLILRHPGEPTDEEDGDQGTSVESMLSGDQDQQTAEHGVPTTAPGNRLLDLLGTPPPRQTPTTVAQVPVIVEPEVEHRIFIHGDSSVRVFEFQSGQQRPVEWTPAPAASTYSTGSAPFSQSSTGNRRSDSSDLPSFDDFSFGDAD